MSLGMYKKRKEKISDQCKSIIFNYSKTEICKLLSLRAEIREKTTTEKEKREECVSKPYAMEMEFIT